MDHQAETSENALNNNVLKCWGKTDPASVNPQEFHPALFHMIDVAYVAQLLLSGSCSPRWRVNFARIYGNIDGTINCFLPFLVALHDIGKISASFQRMNAQQYQRLKKDGFTFGSSKDLYHTQVSRNFIRYEWPSEPGWLLTEDNLRLLGEMSAGHHGEFISPGELNSVRVRLRMEEPPSWKELRRTASRILADLFLQEPLSQMPTPANISAAAMELTGFTTLCDWIGSDQCHFRPSPNINIDEYIEISEARARLAVEKAGFAGTFRSGIPTVFSTLFSSFSPRPLQLAIDQIPDELLKEPSLVIIEAPTGEGKTEAALALAHRITNLNGYDEFYYALPTTATSNQMHNRVQKYLKDQLKMDMVAKLVHGQAFLQQEALNIQPLYNGEEPNRDSIPIDWFNTKKRALLAPFGVGTIDQIELGALNVRHASLRLAGLSGKVIILDEVHAYDFYMTTIISRLLKWLKALGASVILLSATLPDSRRRELLRAFHGSGKIFDIPSDYPLIVAAGSGDFFTATPKAMQPQRKIGLEFLQFSDDENAQKANWLVEQVSEGGVACWITNTVNRAQNIYWEVQGAAGSDVEVILIHARFPLVQRDELEKLIVSKAGPIKENRPWKMIVIGTQVLEQSLDLDFDLMVSDLAPIDLLLQRAGRLHRHAATKRHGKHYSPVLYINAPMNNEQPEIKSDEYIYAEYILLRTWEIIQDLNSLQLPADYRLLVEQVYGEVSTYKTDEQKNAYEQLKKQEEIARQEAEVRLLPEPDPEELFTSLAAQLVFTESETEAGWKVAQTRLGERSLNLIPLEDHGDFCTLPGSDLPLIKRIGASRSDQFLMLRHQLRISHPQHVVDALVKQNENLPDLFTASTLLRDVMPLWLKNSAAVIETVKGRYILTLDPQLGLTIDKKGG